MSVFCHFSRGRPTLKNKNTIQPEKDILFIDKPIFKTFTKNSDVSLYRSRIQKSKNKPIPLNLIFFTQVVINKNKKKEFMRKNNGSRKIKYFLKNKKQITSALLNACRQALRISGKR